MARRRSKARITTEPVPESTSSLAPHASQDQAAELLKERARLLREVQKKQRQLEQVKARLRQTADEAVARMAPVLERQRRLALELAALFDELLNNPRLAVRARKQLERLRRSLELQGVLEPRDEDEEEEPSHRAPFGHDARGYGSHGARQQPGGAAEREVAGATQVGQQRRSLRDLFRSLARAIHPDQARQEDERERRTEVMKQVTRAYEDGDLARLIELESAWRSEQVLSGAGDPDVRLRELSRLNRELLSQLREVTRQLKDAKRELVESELAFPPAEVLELAELELDDVEAICEVLRRFRDGKVSISDLMDGPLPKPRRKRAKVRRPF